MPLLRLSRRLLADETPVLDIHAAVRITDVGDGLSVDAGGQGLIARRDLREGVRIPDRSATWVSGKPHTVDYSSIQVPTLKGHFKIRWVDDAVPFKTPTYYTNEARDGAEANVKWSWTSVGVGAYVLMMLVIRPIRAGEELLVVYA